MTTLTTREPLDLVREHLEVLGGYASRVLTLGVQLSPSEEADKTERMREYLTMGESLHLTVPEMVNLLLRGVLVDDKKCDCHSCKGRAANDA